MKKFYPLVFVGLVIIFFWQFFLKGLLPVPVDTIVGLYHPWRDLYSQEYPNGIPFKNFLITDPIRQQYPWRYIAINNLKNGKLPVWSPYNFSGSPLIANLQSAVFYPLNVIFFLLPFEYGWSILIIAQPLLAGLFLFFYLRNLNLKKEACLLGSIVYSFGGFFTAWLEWNTILHAALWLPILLLSIDKLVLIFFSEEISKIKNQRSEIPALPAGRQIKNRKLQIITWSLIYLFSVTASFFAGHLQIFFYVFILSLGYLTVRWWQYGRRKKVLLLFTIYYSLFTLITSIQWLPTLKFILSSARGFDQSIWQKEGWFIPWQHLIQFFAPDFFGNPATLNYWGVWNYAEMIGYVGVIPLLFALFNLIFRKDKKTLFFGTLFFLSLIFATPTWFARLPYILKIPLISTSQPTRLLFLIAFSLAVLAALGFDYFLTLSLEKKNKILKKILIIFLFIGLIYGGLWLFVLSSNPLVSEQNMVVAKRNLILPSLTFLTFGFILTITSTIKNKKLKGFLLLTILAVTVFDLFRFSWKFTPFTKKEYLFPETETTKFLQDQKQPFRIMTTDKRIFPPNFSAVYKIQSIDGYDPLYLQNYGQFTAAWIRGKPDISDFSFNRIINIQNFESRFADLLNVRYVLSLDELQSEKLIKVFEEGQTKIYENKNVFPRAFFAEDLVEVINQEGMIEAMFDENIDLRKTAIVYEQDKIDVPDNILTIGESVEITDYQADEIRMKANSSAARLLILSDIYYSAWKVYIDDQEKKIYEVDYVLRGVIVPKGRHEILFVAKLTS